MPTLSGFQGASLVPQVGSRLAQGAQSFSQLQNQQLLRQQAEQQAQREQRRLELVGQNTPESQALLAREFPEQAQNIAAAQKAQLEALSLPEQNRIKSVVVGAAEIQGLNPADQLRRLEDRRGRLIAQGLPTQDTDEVIGLINNGQIDEANAMIDQAVNLGRNIGELEAPTAAQTTSLQKNLVAAGLEPGTPEFQAAVIKGMKKAPLVQIGGGVKEEQKELAKLRAQDLKSLRAKGDEAEQQITSLDVLDNIDVSTGSAEPMKQAIASFAEGLGIDASSLANVAAGEAFTAEAGKVVLRVMATQKGPQTDNDRKNIAKTISRLGNRPEANVFINDSARGIARRTIEQRDFFNDWLDQNESLKGAASAWNKQKRDIPMVSRFVKTPEGLPVFFFRFRDRVQEANPNASFADIKEAWRNQEEAARKK
jgi:hypothetical protein